MIEKIKPLYIFSHGEITGAVILDTRREKNRSQEKKENLYPIRYRVIFQRKASYYKSGYDASLDEWINLPNSKKGESKEKRKLLKSGFDIIENHVKEIKDVFSFDALNRRLGRGKMELVSSAFDARINELNKSGQVGTASIYNSAKLLLMEYKRDLKFANVTAKFLENLEHFATVGRKTTIRYATLGMYLRCFRALYNAAIRDGVVTAASYPFQKIPNDGKYKIKLGSGTKIALTIEQLSSFIEYQTPFKGMQRSKDLFLLSFFLGGINIKDLLLLKWEDIKGTELIYDRSKTAKTTGDPDAVKIRIPLTSDATNLINKHCNTDRSPKARILPFMPIDASPVDVRRITLNVVRNLNRDLYKIAKELNIFGLSSYVARHSIATLMKNSGVSESFIKEMLGHANIKTTQNYLKSFEQAQRWETFEQTINKLKIKKDE
ncbi:MAG: site-specific integrase [Bacteroidales bacterium]